MSGFDDKQDKARAKERASFLQRLLFVPLAGVPCGIAYYFASRGTPPFTWFHWHPFMMLLGFVTLAGNAITSKKLGGAYNTKVHGVLMWMSWACVMFGSYVIYTTKEMYHKEHLTTPHGQFGFLIICAYAPLPLFTGAALWPDLGLLRSNQTVRFAHRWGGRVLLALAWVTCLFGIAGMLKLDKPNHGNEIVALGMFAPFVVFAPLLLM
jgi:hypothetical protein